MSSTRSTDRRQSTARAGRFLPFLILHALLAAPLFAAELPPGFDRERHMLVDEVRPGMLGYGMTVFHGTDPEPFPVEVVSVQKGFAAGKSVVWIRCPSKRMQMTGPVQGMSGSPIYLWPAPANGQAPAARQPGSGGRMIGAFAFGHRLGKDCYVGVQPIENMLQTAGRMPKPGQARAEQASSAAGHQTLAAAFRLAHELKLSPQETWRLRAVSGLLGYQPADEAQAPAAHAAPGHVALPVLAGTAEQAKLLSPFLAPLGLAAVQAPSGAIPASPLRP
ncbi:MAG: hypothetical protein OER86_09750, partial [Phycisphaerae bacterium]|nr:hypothetical protein [Phycisphaerae bacterium]